MFDHAERSRRDEDMWRWHRQALAAGQRRVLSRTLSGELHSYAQDEIGFRRNGPGNGVSTLWGLLVVTSVMAAFGIMTIVIAAGVLAPDRTPAQGFLVLTAFATAMTWWGIRCASAEIKARKIRERRGVPTPSGAPL